MENKKNTKYKVLTDSGYKDFIGVKRSYAKYVHEIKLENGLVIKSTENHVYPTNDGVLLKSGELTTENYLTTKDGNYQVVSNTIITHNDYVYDLLEVADGNLYYANNILTHNCSFLGSGDNVIDDKYVKRQEKHNVKDPIRKEWLDGNMWIWEDPIKDHQYILAADASSGSAADAAGICVFDYTTGNQVAEYQGKVAPDVLGEMCAHYGNSYNAFIVVDITGGWGAATVLKLIDLGYPKKLLYYDITVGIDALENNRSLQKHMDNGKLPGLNFQKNRNLIISELEKGVRMDTFKLRSARALMEMDTFVYINGRPDHMKGYHDDLLMSIGMALFVAMSSFKDLEKSKGQAKAMVGSWVVTSTDSTDVDTLSRNVDFYMANNEVNRVQLADSPHNWVFGGMYGFKNKGKKP